MLNREQAKTFYDRLGSRQDSQAFYEDPAIRDLIAEADFETARSIFEFGCGTGRGQTELLIPLKNPLFVKIWEIKKD